MQTGLVTPSVGSSWLGGLYIVQNLVLAVSLLPSSERPGFRDVYWGSRPEDDPWLDIRPHLGVPAVISLPETISGRVRRRLGRRFRRGSMRDLFEAAGIDVLFPVRIVETADVPFLFFIPDFQHHYLPQINDERVRDYFEERFRGEAAVASRIYVSSESVLRDVERFLPAVLDKVRCVFPVSIPMPFWYERDPLATARSLGLPDRYFAIPNMVAAHKNHLSIARALAVLKQRGIHAHVVCTGRKADYRHPEFFEGLMEEVRALGVEDRLHFTGVLERAEQMAVIRRAVGIIQPSLFEGWGAAVAEAKALGKPLLASDLAVHREHGPDDVRWIEPHDVEGWADGMIELLASRSSGPDPEAETAARARIMREALGVGRAFAKLLRETA